MTGRCRRRPWSSRSPLPVARLREERGGARSGGTNCDVPRGTLQWLGASEVEDHVDGGGELVLAGQAVKEVFARPVIPDLGSDLQISADLACGHRRNRHAERRLVEVLCNGGDGAKALVVAEPLQSPGDAEA